jgi:hypothetical protein
MLPIPPSRIRLLLILAALPLLVGSSCAFFFSSGGGSPDKDNTVEKEEEEEEEVIVVQTGTFGAPPAEGVSYESGSISGVTGRNGEFQYEDGSAVRFFIGDVDLGSPVSGKSVITPLDLVVDNDSDATAAINIERLLQSLDSDPGDEVITIPKEVRTAAVRSNEGVSSAIEFLDFSDDSAFANAASQLVAVLTLDYPFTASLVDADIAQDREMKSLGH